MDVPLDSEPDQSVPPPPPKSSASVVSSAPRDIAAVNALIQLTQLLAEHSEEIPIHICGSLQHLRRQMQREDDESRKTADQLAQAQAKVAKLEMDLAKETVTREHAECRLQEMEEELETFSISWKDLQAAARQVVSDEVDTIQEHRTELFRTALQYATELGACRVDYRLALAAIVDNLVLGNERLHEIPVATITPLLQEELPGFNGPQDIEFRPFWFYQPFAGSGFAGLAFPPLVSSTRRLLLVSCGTKHFHETPTRLAELIWIDQHLLAEVCKENKVTVRCLLLMKYLINACYASEWLHRAIACTNLANLAGRFMLKDQSSWARIVGNIIDCQRPFNDDPLTQACLVSLAATVSSPADLIRRILGRDLRVHQLKDMSIPDLVILLSGQGSKCANFAHLRRSRQKTVIVRNGQKEIIFTIDPADFGRLTPHGSRWRCSIQGFTIKALNEDHMIIYLAFGREVGWSKQDMRFDEYMRRFHGNRIAKALYEKSDRQVKSRLRFAESLVAGIDVSV